MYADATGPGSRAGLQADVGAMPRCRLRAPGGFAVSTRLDIAATAMIAGKPFDRGKGERMRYDHRTGTQKKTHSSRGRLGQVFGLGALYPHRRLGRSRRDSKLPAKNPFVSLAHTSQSFVPHKTSRRRNQLVGASGYLPIAYDRSNAGHIRSGSTELGISDMA
jgi:hypothetical protein